MALQMFMKLEGVPGDSTNYEYKGWCDVLSWNWGMTSNRKTVQGNGEDKTALNEISIVKPLGIDSPVTRLLFAQGKRIPSVEFSVTPIMGKREAQAKYMYFKLEDVVIKSIVSSGSSEDKFFREQLTLCFDRIRFEFSQGASLSSSGSGESTPGKDFNFRWNVPSNAEIPA
jgi:type VI secretion system secreted protein Hcp